MNGHIASSKRHDYIFAHEASPKENRYYRNEVHMTSRIGRLVGFLAMCTFISPAFASGKCTLGTLVGDYGFSASGLLPEAQKDGSIRYDPLTQITLVRFDGKGEVKIYSTIQSTKRGGGLNVSGKYFIEDSCVGRAELHSTDGSVVMWRFVVVHGGNDIETLETFPGTDSRPVYSMSFTQKKL
jgi:hypothetical protein